MIIDILSENDIDVEQINNIISCSLNKINENCMNVNILGSNLLNSDICTSNNIYDFNYE